MSHVDGLRPVPDLPGPFLRGGDEEITPRFRGNDEEFLGLSGVGEENEFHLASFHGLACIRMQVIVSKIAPSLDDVTDLRLASVPAPQDVYWYRRHVLRGF